MIDREFPDHAPCNFLRLPVHLEDKRLLKLIQAFLNAGVMQNGLVAGRASSGPF